MITRKKLFSNLKYMSEIKNLKSIELGQEFNFSQLTLDILQGCIQFDVNHRLKPEELYCMLQLNNLYHAPFQLLNIGKKVSNPVIYNKSSIISIPNEMKTTNLCQFISNVFSLPLISATTIQEICPKDSKSIIISVFNETPYLIIGKLIYFYLTKIQIKGSFMLPMQIEVSMDDFPNIKELVMLVYIAKQCLFESQQTRKSIEEISQMLISFIKSGHLPSIKTSFSTNREKIIFSFN